MAHRLLSFLGALLANLVLVLLAIFALVPLVLMVAASLGLGYLFWDAAIDAVNGTLAEWSLVAMLFEWLDRFGMSGLKSALAPLIVVFVATPVIVIVALLCVSILMTPSMLHLVAERRFSSLERKRGGSMWMGALGSLLATLELTRRPRIFQKMSVPDIVKKVLEAGGVPADKTRWELSASYPARAYCAQYRETDWAFIHRLLAEEGARIIEGLGAETRFFDPRELPIYGSVPDTHPKVQELRALSQWSEAQVWSSPAATSNFSPAGQPSWPPPAPCRCWHSPAFRLCLPTKQPNCRASPRRRNPSTKPSARRA